MTRLLLWSLLAGSALAHPQYSIASLTDEPKTEDKCALDFSTRTSWMNGSSDITDTPEDIILGVVDGEGNGVTEYCAGTEYTLKLNNKHVLGSWVAWLKKGAGAFTAGDSVGCDNERAYGSGKINIKFTPAADQGEIYLQAVTASQMSDLVRTKKFVLTAKADCGGAPADVACAYEDWDAQECVGTCGGDADSGTQTRAVATQKSGSGADCDPAGATQKCKPAACQQPAKVDQAVACACKDTWTQKGYRDDHTCKKAGADITEDVPADGWTKATCDTAGGDYADGDELCTEAKACGGGDCAGHDEHWCEVKDAFNCDDAEAWGRCEGEKDEFKLPAGCVCEETWKSDDCDEPDKENSGCAEPCDKKTNNETHKWCMVKRSADCSIWKTDDDNYHGGHFAECAKPEADVDCAWNAWDDVKCVGTCGGAADSGIQTREKKTQKSGSGTDCVPADATRKCTPEACADNTAGTGGDVKPKDDSCECKDSWAQKGYRDDHSCKCAQNDKGECDENATDKDLKDVAIVEKSETEEALPKTGIWTKDECEGKGGTYTEGEELCMKVELCGGGDCAGHDESEGGDWCEVKNAFKCADAEAYGRCEGGGKNVLPTGCECMETWKSEDCDKPDKENSGCPDLPCDAETNNETHKWCLVKRSKDCPLWDETDDDEYHGGHFVDCTKPGTTGAGVTGETSPDKESPATVAQASSALLFLIALAMW